MDNYTKAIGSYYNTELSANAQVSASEVQVDPITLDENELTAISIINKRNLTDQESSMVFEQAVDSKDEEAIKDLQTLQRALRADGKYNGPIDEDFGKGSKAGVNLIIGENAQAINSYYDAVDRLQSEAGSQVSPSSSDIDKTQQSEKIRQ